jgi:hypothetical protein
MRADEPFGPRHATVARLASLPWIGKATAVPRIPLPNAEETWEIREGRRAQRCRIRGHLPTQ